MEIPLSDTTYQTIRSEYKKTKDKRTATYLNIILLKHKQYSQIQIADILNIDENTVCTWVKKFETSSNLDEYLKLNYSGYVGKLSYVDLGKVNNFIENTTSSDTKPIIEEIKNRFSVRYSISGVTKLLNRLNFSYKQKVALPSKMDAQKQEEFVEKYASIEKSQTEKSAIFFMDAVHPQHNTHTLKAWLPKGKPSYILTNSGRNRLNINGLYNPYTQETFVTYHRTINAQATIELFEELKKQKPLHENLYIFSDNAKYYVSKVLKEYLAQNPVIQLIHLPPYSPNLNLIERLWKYMRKVVINPQYHEKFETFTNAIKSFFDNIEEHKQELAQFIGLKFRLFELN
jgi:transposase